MNLERRPGGQFVSTVTDRERGTSVTFVARSLRRERVGLHAWVAIKLDGITVAYDSFNIERDADRLRLAKSAINTIDDHPDAPSVSLRALKRHLDDCCFRLAEEHIPRVRVEWLAGDHSLSGPTAIIDPYLYDETGTILFAPPGRGKTYTALIMAVVADSGLDGSPVGAAPRPTKTLFVNLERSQRSLTKRLAQVNLSLGLDPQRELAFINARGASLADVSDLIKLAVQDEGFELVILDSISRAGYGDLNDNATANRIVETLNQLGVAWLAIGHTPRANESHLYGSVHFEAGADMVLMQQADWAEGSRSLGIAITCTKANDVPYPQPRFVSYQFNEVGLCNIDRAAPEDFVSLRASSMPAADRITEYLRTVGSATAQQIADATGIARSYVFRTLRDPRFKKGPKDGRSQPYVLAELSTNQSSAHIADMTVDSSLPNGMCPTDTSLGDGHVDTSRGIHAQQHQRRPMSGKHPSP